MVAIWIGVNKQVLRIVADGKWDWVNSRASFYVIDEFAQKCWKYMVRPLQTPSTQESRNDFTSRFFFFVSAFFVYRVHIDSDGNDELDHC